MVALERDAVSYLFHADHEPNHPLTPREKIARDVHADLLKMGNILMHHFYNDFPAELAKHLPTNFVNTMRKETREETALLEKYHIDRKNWNLGAWSMALAAAKLYPTIVQVAQANNESALKKGLSVTDIKASLQQDPSGATWLEQHYTAERPHQRGQELSDAQKYGINIVRQAIQQQFSTLS